MKKPVNHSKRPTEANSKIDFSYPPNEDIYNNYKEESEIDPENLSLPKSPNQAEIGDDLDVPGSELDDEQENIGSEDEENNYYSIGGDNHNDLEEDKGE
jgi:hypothetical protein